MKPSMTYPINITDVDVSSLVNKALHSVSMTFFSCKVWGSTLIRRKVSMANRKSQVSLLAMVIASKNWPSESATL